jgi:hypothetical protein
MTRSTLWLPIEPSEDRVCTSATLDEGPTRDRVVLYVLGERAADFTLALGLGGRFLAECGMEEEA